MKYGVQWYVGEGEHDYKESGRQEYATLRELFDGLRAQGPVLGEEALFQALVSGRQDTIHWITDDWGFELYVPGD